MKFKKGSRVEVFSKKEGPSGAWRCGEVVFSGNGHAYSVKYDYPPGEPNEDLVERVSSKAIRPHPPPVNDVFNGWTAGDVVEVFDDLYWKTAAILKVFSQNYYLVRLIESSTELRLHKINIRVRQLWQDGKWVVIGKGSGSREDMKSNKLSTLSFNLKTSSPMLKPEAKTKIRAGENCFADGINAGFQDSYTVTARTLKRASPFWSSDIEACNGKALKMRAMEEKRERLQVISGCSSSFVNKGHSWKHACIASKGLKMMLGATAISLAQQMRPISTSNTLQLCQLIPVADVILIYSNAIAHFWTTGTMHNLCGRMRKQNFVKAAMKS